MPYVRRYFLDDSVDELLPFQLQFSFKKIFAYWEDLAAGGDTPIAAHAREVLAKVNRVPKLREPFDDAMWLEAHVDEVKLLLSPLFPPLTSTNEIKAVYMLYQPFLFNATKRFDNILEAAEGDLQPRAYDRHFRYIHGCVFILNSMYKANINYARHVYLEIPNKKSGLVKRYRALLNADFCELRVAKHFAGITEQDIREMVDNFGDITLWKKKIPPGSFLVEGFAIAQLFDVTKEEAVSDLKLDLLKRDALLMPDIVERIRVNLCAMLDIPNLKLGFAAYNNEREMLTSLGYGVWNSIILSDKKRTRADEAFCEFSHRCVIGKRLPYVAQEVPHDAATTNPLLQKLIKHNLKSYAAVPLMYNDELVGILELGSDAPRALNPLVVNRLDEVVSLFTTALKRSKDEFETQLEAVIQQNCTAIHPSVSWRFFEAAEKFVESQRFFQQSTMEDIVFSQVYPLYGQQDIQGSSTERNLSIQADLIEQLTLANSVLECAVERYTLPIYRELQFRIGQYTRKLHEGISAGDETVVLEFLRSEIYPVFNFLQTQGADMHEPLRAYHGQLDDALGMVYKRRKQYEESVKLINETISEHIEKAQRAAQVMFPHYFEKYKTDGVEHNIYIGESLVNNKPFNMLHLQNLRLWQLLMMCEVENLVQQLKPQLQTKLEICSLVLVQGNPLSIRFRMDEKKFDVDGAYNVRYEIVKKRIDKAVIKGTAERLTQPGKLAIVYSQDKEAKEYVHYLEYLQSINYIGSNIEWLELEDLQGITGLKGIRCEIVYSAAQRDARESKAIQIAEAMRN
jgi:hypothetical protein